MALAACDRAPPEPVKAAHTAEAPKPVSVRTRYPAAERVVAIGDLHGDFAAARAVLRLAGVSDGEHWTGGAAVVVQTGDVLDRGGGEQAILDLFERLEGEAEKAGGRFIALNGNHELMNAAGDFRYVTEEGFRDFDDAPGIDPALAPPVPKEQRARAAALSPGGAYARRLAKHPVVAIVGDSVFVHGGVLPKYAAGIERMNDEVATWLAGGSRDGARILADQDGPVWTRRYSDDPDEGACRLAAEALAKLGAKRMVVGHTVMKTITPACSEAIWRIDVGMSAVYGGKPEALEIRGDRLRAIRAD